MKIYTKTGDKGMTSLVYGTRVAKNDVLVEAYGTCDEANSMIGLAVGQMAVEFFDGKEELDGVFHEIQTTLFHVGAELATPHGKEVKWKLTEQDVEKLERWIDLYDEKVPPLNNFILPGGHPAGAALHVARTVVRRTERAAISIGEDVSPLVLVYLNRLSDFLFVAARFINLKLGKKEQELHSQS
ncbi:cob(I)yrinic acid a,c-diamide adenosyltransferase [Planococcus sp. N028]|uniref:Corrinoid adenosyltransferase n=1 Tax=Planococcus shixiaomingii TaxID=3058393 RepID=A0ABT8N7J7_9BACL|nr:MULTISPECIES: cob(I)yrinic acid a,c-diamide adenosyltransferase [unclassified Planococcus (in: firmicutes)]MDN7243709.1 cob(I)yrinic acid a,c-diamide adenosyltransferase [Planococcus sp. N028]WKA55845.1 cob(I)yrinic acid a,c-diamide adenosyltransferase [Planococcus sp. N022]